MALLGSEGRVLHEAPSKEATCAPFVASIPRASSDGQRPFTSKGAGGSAVTAFDEASNSKREVLACWEYERSTE